MCYLVDPEQTDDLGVLAGSMFALIAREMLPSGASMGFLEARPQDSILAERSGSAEPNDGPSNSYYDGKYIASCSLEPGQPHEGSTSGAYFYAIDSRVSVDRAQIMPLSPSQTRPRKSARVTGATSFFVMTAVANQRAVNPSVVHPRLAWVPACKGAPFVHVPNGGSDSSIPLACGSFCSH
ncbi:hypothetical protein GQ53DRAFT_451482 [Thozetella sp. PMI_491]|nr:hypothetical protein GQ53DRAFT_451482 [Thozetella sp. PMI_491]